MEMARWVKELAAKLDNLGLISGTQVIEENLPHPQVILWPMACSIPQ